MLHPDSDSSMRGATARHALTAAVMLGILADPLLRNMPWGAGLLVWMVVFAAVVLVVIRASGLALSRESMVCLTLAVLFGAGLSWRDADAVQAFDVIAMLLSLGLLAMSLNAIPVPHLALARVRDLIRSAFGTGLDVATGAVPLLMRDLSLNQPILASRAGNAKRIAKALLITVPILLVFTLMLRSADPLFQSYFAFPNIQLGVLLSHVVIAGIFAWIVAGWLHRSLLTQPRSGESALPT